MGLVEEAFLIENREGVAILSFNRPDVGNAIPSHAVAPLAEFFRSVQADPSVRALIIRGQGKHLSSGGDIQAFGRSLEQPVSERRADFAARLDRTAAMVESYMALEIPVVVACKGGVAGGGLLFVLGADFVLSDNTAAFFLAHQRVGLVPDCGVSYLLPRVVGERKALELVLNAGKIDAEEAQRIGMVDRIVAADALDAEVLGLAQRLAQGPSSVMRRTKQLIRAAALTPLDQHVRMEREAIVCCVGEPAFEEGVRSFLEKRRP